MKACTHTLRHSLLLSQVGNSPTPSTRCEPPLERRTEQQAIPVATTRLLRSSQRSSLPIGCVYNSLFYIDALNRSPFFHFVPPFRTKSWSSSSTFHKTAADHAAHVRSPRRENHKWFRLQRPSRFSSSRISPSSTSKICFSQAKSSRAKNWITFVF